jgi:hypothetical protein
MLPGRVKKTKKAKNQKTAIQKDFIGKTNKKSNFCSCFLLFFVSFLVLSHFGCFKTRRVSLGLYNTIGGGIQEFRREKSLK